MNDTNLPEQEKEETKVGFWQIVMSTLAAFIGVQSNKNRVRDFQHGNFGAFITAGIIATVIFIFTMIILVRLALSQLT